MYRLGDYRTLEVKGNGSNVTFTLKDSKWNVALEFPLRRLKAFLDVMSELEENVRNFLVTRRIKYCRHIGRGIFLQIHSGFQNIIVRRYVLRQRVFIPTLDRILLSLSFEWKELPRVIEQLRHDFPIIDETKPCFCVLDHPEYVNCAFRANHQIPEFRRSLHHYQWNYLIAIQTWNLTCNPPDLLLLFFVSLNIVYDIWILIRRKLSFFELDIIQLYYIHIQLELVWYVRWLV